MITLHTSKELDDGHTHYGTYPDLVYDYAIPQDWVDAMVRRGFDPRGHVVWGYPRGGIAGQPYPITVEGMLGLARIAGGVNDAS
jgi:hypothetical protein